MSLLDCPPDSSFRGGNHGYGASDVVGRHPLLALGGRFLGHAAAVVLGFVLIIVGLALGVTMIMLPVGVVVAMMGVAILIMGLFARIDEKS